MPRYLDLGPKDKVEPGDEFKFTSSVFDWEEERSFDALGKTVTELRRKFGTDLKYRRPISEKPVESTRARA